jgi:hypothetical protein
MELDKFVSKTLMMICKGVSEAQASAKEFGGNVNENPQRAKSSDWANNATLLQQVEFDIAVTTEDTSNGEGKISVLGMGSKGGNNSKDTVSSRINFKIPISFSKLK